MLSFKKEMMYLKLTKNALGLAIKDARERLNITQAQLAEMVNISDTHLKHIEGGSRKPSVEVLFRLMDKLHLSIDSLVFQEEPPVSQAFLKVYRMLQKSSERELKVVITTLEALREPGEWQVEDEKTEV